MGVVTWDGSASTDYGTAANWDSGVVPSASSNVVIPDTSSINNCILDTARTVNSFRIDTNGTFDGDGNLLTVDSEGDASTGASEGYAVNIDGIIAGTDTDIQITTPATASVDFNASSGNIRNLTVNHASCVLNSENSCVLSGNLTITAGNFNANGNILTVAGTTQVTGTLTCGSSAISLGNNVDDAYSVVVNGSGTFTGGSGTHILGAINVNSSATNFTFSSGNTTITGRATSGNSRRVLSTSATDRITAAGTLIIDQARTPLSIRCDDTTGINNLTMNCGAGRVLHIDNDLTVGGILNVSAGTVTTRNVGDSVDNDLTVTGKTTIGAGSGSASDAVLTCNDSTISLGSGSTSVTGLHVTVGGTFTGGTGPHTIGSILADNSAALSVTLTDDVTTINGKQYSSSSIFIATGGTFAHGGGTVNLTYAGTTRVYMYNNKALNNFTVNNGGNTAEIYQDLTCAGNLTITAGTVNTMSSLNSDLTVTGLCKVYGTLTSNSSTITVGALHLDGGTYSAPDSSGSTIINDESGNQAFDNDGTFTHNGGTVTITTAGNSQIDWIGTGSGNLNNLTYSGGAILEWTVNGGTIDGNLNITNGTLQSSNGNKALTVTGNVIVGDGTGSANTAILGNASEEAAQTFGSLTIDSDGKYNATSGTTTITSESGAGYAANVDGTFTHNNGTLTITTPAHTYMSPITPYNLIINHSSANVRYTGAPDSTMTIANDLTITAGVFDPDDGNENLTVTGDVSIASGGTLGASDVTSAMSFGSLTIASGGTYNATSGTTTITNETSGGNAINNDGTFTHNKGTVKIDYDSSTNLDLTGTGSVDLYNLIVDSDATVGYNAAVMENNLTKQGSGRMRPSGDSGRNIEVKGTLLIEAGTFGRGANDTHTNTFGNVVLTGGTIDLTGGGGSGKTIVKGSFRNVGGTVNTP